MKNAIIIAILINVVATGQAQTIIQEENRDISKGNHNCLVLDLPNTNAQKVVKHWTDFMKDHKEKTAFNEKTNELFIDDAIIKTISDTPIDIYIKIIPKNRLASEMCVWYNMGVNYLSSKKHPNQYRAAKKLLQNFAASLSADRVKTKQKNQSYVTRFSTHQFCTHNVLREILKDQEKMLRELEGEQKEMAKQRKISTQSSLSTASEYVQIEETYTANSIAKIKEIDKQKLVVENIKSDLR